MGYGAIIGGLISGIASAVSDFTQSSPGSQANQLAITEAHQIHQARDKYIDPFTSRGFWNLDMPGAVAQSYATGMQYAPRINQAQMQQLQSLLNQALPGYQGMVGQMATNLGSMLRGNVPADVQDQIQRFGAQQALTSGIGAGGPSTVGMGKTITARDLGLTSLSLEQGAMGQLPGFIGMARNYLMPQPVNPMSILPFQDIIAGQQWTDQAEFEANMAGYTSAVQQAVAQSGQVPTISPGLAGASTIGGMLSSLGQTNPQTGQSGFGMLGGLFGKLFNFGGMGGGTSLGGQESMTAMLGAGGGGGGMAGLASAAYG